MNMCRNCIYWQQTSQWKGNCTKHPWNKSKYNEDATTNGCKDYEDKYIKVASAKEAKI